jgi:hypothetical protein
LEIEPMAEIRPEFWIAAYAAIVATGALVLGIRRWLEAGPRLRITLIPEGMTMGGGPDVDEDNLILITVTNRGEAATMITNLLVFEFENWIQRVRRASSSTRRTPAL